MIYMEVKLPLYPGKRQEFIETVANEVLPLVSPLGMRLVVAWQTAFGLIDEVRNVWCFESISHLDQVLSSLAKDPKWWEAANRARSLAHSETVTLYSTLPYSPMK